MSRHARRVLVVELDESVSVEDVRARLLGALSWSRVTEVRALKRMPMDRRHNAKIDYPALLERLRKEG